MVKKASDIFRYHNVKGVPSSGNHKPEKIDIIEWGTYLENMTQSGGIAVISETRSGLPLNVDANGMGWVVRDPVNANNGIYRKNGASGSGTWTRVADLPYSFVTANDTDAGTPNAIIAISDIPVSESSLIVVKAEKTNTASPVTITFNGGTALEIVSNTGSSIAIGGISSGMQLLGYIVGDKFQLVSDQASASIIAQAEDAADRAEQAAIDAEEAAGSVQFPVSYVKQTLTLSQKIQVHSNIGSMFSLSDLAELESQQIPDSIDSVYLSERVSGHGGGAKWVSSESEPDVPNLAKTQDAGGRWWSISVDDIITPEQLGAFPHIVCEPETKAWYDACSVKPTYLHLMRMDRTIRYLKMAGLWSKITSFIDVMATSKADAGINIKSPGVKDATLHGSGTFVPGFGYTGNGTDAYIGLTAWNRLINQNAAFILACIQTDEGGIGSAVSSVAGAASNISIVPRATSGNFTARLNNSTVFPASRNSRAAKNYLISRHASGDARAYIDGEFLVGSNEASVAVSSDIGTMLRSGGGYYADTAKIFVAGNVALSTDNQDADNLSLIMDWHASEIPSFIGSGPTCDEVGFAQKTAPSDMLSALNSCVELASDKALTVSLGFGTYLSSGTYNGATSLVTTKGVNKLGTVIAADTSMSANSPMVAPSHFNGGESLWSVQNMTVDHRAMARGITNTATSDRPGASAISTNGSCDYTIHNVDVLEGVLHGIDMSNTGEVVSGSRSYDPLPAPDKYISGVIGLRGRVTNVRGYSCGDDVVTRHYSQDDVIIGVQGYFPSGRHSGGKFVSMVVESDDGANGGEVHNVYGRGFYRLTAIKNHAPAPAPKGVTMTGIVGERVGCLIYCHDANESGDNCHTLRDFTLTRPYRLDIEEKYMGVHINGVTDVSLSNYRAIARGDESFLWPALAITNAAKRISVNTVMALNWAVKDDASTPSLSTIRISSAVEGASLSDVNLTGCGKYGINDSGSLAPDFSSIRGTGPGVDGSFLVRFGGASTRQPTNRAVKAIDTFSAGNSGFTGATTGF